MGFVPFNCKVCGKPATNMVQDQVEIWNYTETLLLQIVSHGPMTPLCTEHKREPIIGRIAKGPRA